MGAGATVFLLVSDDREQLLRAGLWALTAASVGEQVQVLLTAGPLRALLAGTPPPPRAVALGLPGPAALLADARALGARVVTCDTELLLAEVAASDALAVVDAVESLPSFWRATAAARLVVV